MQIVILICLSVIMSMPRLHGTQSRSSFPSGVVNPSRIARSLLETDKFVLDVTSLNGRLPSTQ